MNIPFLLLTAMIQFSLHIVFVMMNIKFGGLYWLLYLPIFIVRGGLWAFTGLGKCKTDSLWKLFSYAVSKTTASYLQACIWQIFIVVLLVIRPIWFYQMVTGRGNSPCGKSSCSRDSDFNLWTGNYNQIYNPAGWFPTGEYSSYDKLGTTDYVFCDFGESCRWADNNKENIVRYTEMTNPQCTPNFDEPMNDAVDDETKKSKSVATKRLEDYPNPGVGILGGFDACQKNPSQVACPGNIQGAAPITTKLSGRRVCSVCGHYKDTYKAVLGVPDEFGHAPIWANPDIECAPKPDGSVNVFCMLCPARTETTDESELLTIIVLNICLVAEAFVCMVIVARGVLNSTKELCEEEDKQEDDKQTAAEEEKSLSVVSVHQKTYRKRRQIIV